MAYVTFFNESWVWYTGLDLTEIEPANLALITAFPTVLLTALGAMFTKMYLAYQAYSPGEKEQKDGG